MKVKELIEILSTLDPEAAVVLASQPSYPMEYALRGVAVRSDFCEDERLSSGAQPSDVLLLEGSHLRYGARAAWDQPRFA